MSNGFRAEMCVGRLQQWYKILDGDGNVVMRCVTEEDADLAIHLLDWGESSSELLAALEKALPALEEFEADAASDVRAAIAKAKGGAQ